MATITFVDERTAPLAPRETWHTLSIDELISTKSRMFDLLYSVKSNQGAAKKIILEAIQELDTLIQ